MLQPLGELARAFNRMAEELAAVDRRRRELVANVSHELRTPVAALCAVLENLVDGVAEPDPVALRTALDQAERLATLASDLLDLARVDAGEAQLSTTQVPVLALLDRAVAEARVAGREVGYDVRATPPALTATADPARLHQLVANLFDNASRHSPAGGVVRVTARDTGAGWRLEVADDGPGISAVDRDRVFERFGTLAEAGGGGGTGLGLTISAQLVELMGGRIWLASQTGQGSRFSFVLRFARAPLPAPEAPPPDALRGVRVLVVDDNQTSRAVLDGVLGDWHAVPGTAASADSALTMLRDGVAAGAPWAVALIDEQMPVGQQRDEHAIQQPFLTDDETLQVRFELPELFL